MSKALGTILKTSKVIILFNKIPAFWLLFTLHNNLPSEPKHTDTEKVTGLYSLALKQAIFRSRKKSKSKVNILARLLYQHNKHTKPFL
jgi:hypothetical protein